MATDYRADYDEATDREDWWAACASCHDSGGPYQSEQSAVDWSDDHHCNDDSRGGWFR
jgi:hypothetical protein